MYYLCDSCTCLCDTKLIGYAVRPKERIIDYRTKYSGVRFKDIAKGFYAQFVDIP